MKMNMVLFNRLRGAIDSLRASTDVFLAHDCVVASVEGRQKRRLSDRTVEYQDDYSTRGEAAAWNWNHALAFCPERPDWPAPKSYGRRTEWREVEVPRTLLAGLGQDFLRYHGIVPWNNYCVNSRIVTVWVAVPTEPYPPTPHWPVEESATQPEVDGPIVPPLSERAE
jgi:hypothetical protein